MNLKISRNIALGLAAVSVLGIVVGFYLSQFYEGFYLPLIYSNCNIQYEGCKIISQYVSWAMVYGFGALALVSTVLLFLPKAFSWWLKFAVIAIPLIVWDFCSTFTLSTAGWQLISPRETYIWDSGLFVALSIIVILANVVYRKFIKQRRGVQQ